ncbi:MAG: class I SAM-dependent DNA methyltransferase, partial [Pedobacter sp.]
MKPNYYNQQHISVFVSQYGSQAHFVNSSSWTILTPIEQSIKSKIEALGTPLRNWDININRGILTGYNEAFIIDGNKKDELLALDPKSAEIIRPILRGRDIKRYNYNFADLWLINTHNGIKDKNLMPIAIDDYPAIKQHLNYYYADLEKRTDKGITPYNLRNCAYMEDFSKQKIIWKIIGDQMAFSIDSSDLLVNNACYILTGDGLKYLLAILNSRLIKWYSYLTNMNKTGVGDMQIGAQNVLLFPIPRIPAIEQKPLSDLVERILIMKKNNEDTTILESDVENLTFELFGLTEEEIAFI